EAGLAGALSLAPSLATTADCPRTDTVQAIRASVPNARMRFRDTARIVIEELSPVVVSPPETTPYSQWGYASRGAGLRMPGILSYQVLASPVRNNPPPFRIFNVASALFFP